MRSLKVVCLISGGKDSLFSILHCLENGHEVVALANLHPPHEENQEDVEDMDSYMYQTIGHAIIPLYEAALGLPLYRQSISGSAVNQSKCYDPVNGAFTKAEDETEALVPLLRRIQSRHPEVNAVSTGAILSDYQRTRVESVAVRLALTPISFLWQWPALPPHSQTSLLEDMAAVGQDSRIVKVASGGLDDSFLWQNVADPRTFGRLDTAAKRFGSGDDGAVLGEGGEYETLAVSGPAPLWKSRIVVDEDQRQVLVGDAGSASIKLLKAHTEVQSDTNGATSKLRIPPLLEIRFQTILAGIRFDGPCSQPKARREDTMLASTMNQYIDGSNPQSNVPDHLFLSNVTGDGITPAEQMQSIMIRISESLRASKHCFSDVAYTTIILRDMNDFASINPAYGAHYSHPNPPARVTIACAGILPKGKHLTVSMTSVKLPDPDSRRGLHVQSRSYWAPANIGPYSQAISVPLRTAADVGACELVYIAGQIPLVPASMVLPLSTEAAATKDFAFQTVLAQQHFERIGQVMHVKQWACAIAFITADSSEDASMRSEIAHQAWEALHQHQPSEIRDQDDEVDSFDVWDAKFGTARSHHPQHTHASRMPRKDHHHVRQTPPLYVVRVDSLPRHASIEWVTYGVTDEFATRPEIPHLQHLLHRFKDNII